MNGYIYRPYLRPVGFATMPKDIEWDYVEAPADQPQIAKRRCLPLSTNRYGVIVVNRPFTAEERDHYGMEPA